MTLQGRSTLRLLSVLLAAGAGLSAAPEVSAAGWNITSHDFFDSRDECLNQAKKVIHRYDRLKGVGETSQGSWTYYAYDLEPGGDSHMVFMCTSTGSGQYKALQVTHGPSGDDRREAHEAVKGIWEDLGRP